MMKQSDHGVACPANPMYGCAVLHYDKEGNVISCPRECNCGVEAKKCQEKKAADVEESMDVESNETYIII